MLLTSLEKDSIITSIIFKFTAFKLRNLKFYTIILFLIFTIFLAELPERAVVHVLFRKVCYEPVKYDEYYRSLGFSDSNIPEDEITRKLNSRIDEFLRNKYDLNKPPHENDTDTALENSTVSALDKIIGLYDDPYIPLKDDPDIAYRMYPYLIQIGSKDDGSKQIELKDDDIFPIVHEFFINSGSLFINEYLLILVYFLISILLSYVILGLSYELVVQKPETEKTSGYECGFESYEDARQKFNVKFYLLAILFILFDIEAMFLIPWCVTLSLINYIGYLVMMEFILELFLGFLYVWYIGGLDWE